MEKEVRYQKVYRYIIDRMNNEIDPVFQYHNVPHVLDVLDSAVRIAKSEGISDEQMELLKVAVLFHDSGFIKSPVNHEATGCLFASEFLPTAGYSEKEIDIVCRLIMATRVPHQPETLLEQIICDADLDYLGRDDFFTTGNKIFHELIAMGSIADEREWNELQVKFLSAHRYFTKTSIASRLEKKKTHIDQVKAKLSSVV
jgi:uncharacterized protein